MVEPTKLTTLPLTIALLTVSDTRGPDDDGSGDYLAAAIESANHRLAARAWVKDEQSAIVDAITPWVEDDAVSVVLTTGGTGITARDVTPEAVAGMFEQTIDGFGELFRWLSYDEIGTSTIQSRACAGVVNRTLLFCLPGSTGACRLAWEKILLAQLNHEHRPCNFAELLPRL